MKAQIHIIRPEERDDDLVADLMAAGYHMRQQGEQIIATPPRAANPLSMVLRMHARWLEDLRSVLPRPDGDGPKPAA